MTTYERLKPIIMQQLGVDEADVTEQATFREDLGADSLDVAELAMGIEEEWELPYDTITNEDEEKCLTVGDAVKMIDEILAR